MARRRARPSLTTPPQHPPHQAWLFWPALRAGPRGGDAAVATYAQRSLVGAVAWAVALLAWGAWFASVDGGVGRPSLQAIDWRWLQLDLMGTGWWRPPSA